MVYSYNEIVLRSKKGQPTDTNNMGESQKRFDDSKRYYGLIRVPHPHLQNVYIKALLVVIPQYMTLCILGLSRSNKGKMRSHGWALMQYAVLSKKKKLGHRQHGDRGTAM